MSTAASSTSFTCHSPLLHRPIAPSPISVAVAIPRSLPPLPHLKTKRRSSTTTYCSADAAKDKDSSPIELRYEAFPTVMDINQIREILPHRFPFLLVDRVIEYNAGVSAVAIKNVTINDNFFPGHFPERPIMPGVLMVENLERVSKLEHVNWSPINEKEAWLERSLEGRVCMCNIECGSKKSSGPDSIYLAVFKNCREVVMEDLNISAMAQVGGLVMLQPEVGGSRDTFFFAGIDKVRFRKPVIAGDTLVMRMTLIKLQKRFGIAKMEGKAYVGGEVVCEGEFLMATGTGGD